MIKEFNNDINIIIEKLNDTRHRSSHEYRTLSNALREIFNIIMKDASGVGRDYPYFEAIHKSLIDELQQLGKHRADLLNKRDYKAYHRIIKSYQDISRIEKDVSLIIRKGITYNRQ